ncbi:YiiX/YebB-like N1pC/P60 family cysteine hydrolase [Caballeronia concitans]|uniref:Uncharacterized protein n=1 Tax=Caballeronia concitans TaxID=1777133 RepID=A0A658R5N7_9BURK|nr:YiiX/YebB-like N1pC/P60 family cysteine hydrolase [Caballeronia concitans]SAL52727.1 hypothetical protein AWB72_05629 [Caballeronia concitans]
MHHFFASDTQSSGIGLGAVRAGDLIFVHPRTGRAHEKIKRYLNVKGQRILSGAREGERVSPLKSATRHVRDYSHVMLGLGGGLIIHADGKKVVIDVLQDVVEACTPADSTFKVYRRRSLDPSQAKVIVKAAHRYFATKYSFLSYFTTPSETDTTQFCSRLIAHAYRSANLPLSHLADHRVLPLHLYAACQADEWQDVSSCFFPVFPTGLSSEVLDSIRDLGIFTPEELSFHADTLRGHDEDLLKVGRLRREAAAAFYENAQNILDMHKNRTQLVTLQWQLANEIELTPENIEDTGASIIARVLEQLPQLLELSNLQNVADLIDESMLNGLHDVDGLSEYVGIPDHKTWYFLRVSTEKLRLATYFKLAEVGLFSILAHTTTNEKYARFKSVKRQYASKFDEALKFPTDYLKFKDQSDTFAWLDHSQDRETYRQVVRDIVLCLSYIADRTCSAGPDTQQSEN